jgi:hypothetical protein
MVSGFLGFLQHPGLPEPTALVVAGLMQGGGLFA